MHQIKKINPPSAVSLFEGLPGFIHAVVTDSRGKTVAQSDSPFEHAITLEIRKYDRHFTGALVHEGFSGFISPASPAHPGEVVVAYMSGLGPVDRGSVGPGFRCSFDAVEGEITDVRLEPAFPGFYYVNIRAPNLSSGLASLDCGWDTATRASTTISIGP